MRFLVSFFSSFLSLLAFPRSVIEYLYVSVGKKSKRKREKENSRCSG